jgi:hypothetical protein
VWKLANLNSVLFGFFFCPFKQVRGWEFMSGHNHFFPHPFPIHCSLLSNNSMSYSRWGAHSSVMAKQLCYKPEGRGFETQWGEWSFSISLILTATLGPRVHSASNRNGYQKQKNNFLGSKVRLVRRTDNFTAICKLIV